MEERMIAVRRFSLEGIQTGPPQVSGLERLKKVVFHD
jgi:hypothetical protein